MPVVKYKGGYRVENTTTKKPLSKEEAEKQLAAIKARQAESKKSLSYRQKKR